MKQLLPILISLLLLPFGINAQDGSSRPSEQEDKKKIVTFNGLGRANINNTSIDGNLLEGGHRLQLVNSRMVSSFWTLVSTLSRMRTLKCRVYSA